MTFTDKEDWEKLLETLLMILKVKSNRHMTKSKTYKKSDYLGRVTDAKIQGALGWKIISQREFKQFHAGKGCLLFILFPPLVLFGQTKYIEVTYEKK